MTEILDTFVEADETGEHSLTYRALAGRDVQRAERLIDRFVTELRQMTREERIRASRYSFNRWERWIYNHAEWYVAEVLADARPLAGDGTVQTAGLAGCAAAATAPNEAVGRMVAEAARLSALRPRSRYVWGGSHGSSPTPPNGPFDCSSAVSHLLQVGGFGNPTMDTTALVHWGEPGPGRWVTIFVKPYGPEAHTFIRFSADVTPPGERYWGTSGIVAPGKGPGWIGEDKLSASYMAGFEMRHRSGL